MDSDIIVGFLMILFWIFSSFVARKKAKSEYYEDEMPVEPGEVEPGVTLQEALQDLAKQMGVEVATGPPEAPVASEHRPTASEHRQTAMETSSTFSEHIEVAAEHRQRATEIRRTASEIALDAADHQWSPGEHVRGDVTRARSAAAGITPAVPTAHRVGQSAFAKRLKTDLGNRGSLARAIVLKEILGPPVSLRSPSQD